MEVFLDWKQMLLSLEYFCSSSVSALSEISVDLISDGIGQIYMSQ